jgi:hypothetical protein
MGRFGGDGWTRTSSTGRVDWARSVSAYAARAGRSTAVAPPALVQLVSRTYNLRKVGK